MLPLLHSKCLSLKPPNFLGAVLSKKKHKNKFEELHHHQDQDHLWNIKKQRWDSQRNMLSQVQPRSHAVQRKWGWSSALFREVSISRKCQGFFWKMPRGFLKNAKDVWKSWRFLWGGVRKCEFCQSFLGYGVMDGISEILDALGNFLGFFAQKSNDTNPTLFFSERNL